MAVVALTPRVRRSMATELMAQPGPYQNLARLQRYLDEAAEKSA